MPITLTPRFWMDRIEKTFAIVRTPHYRTFPIPTRGCVRTCGNWISTTLETHGQMAKRFSKLIIGRTHGYMLMNHLDGKRNCQIYKSRTEKNKFLVSQCVLQTMLREINQLVWRRIRKKLKNGEFVAKKQLRIDELSVH